MRRPDGVVRPIRVFGFVLIALSILSLGAFTYWLVSHGILGKVISIGFYLPIPLFLLLHVLGFATGLGVVRFTKWGYRLLKILLYVLLFAFPIGTIVAYLTLSYMKRHHIEEYYGLPTDAGHSAVPVSRVWLMVGIGAIVALYLWMLLSF
ncbi:MAG: hypothetical protein ACREK4_11690 [Candidatus Rokuibacteriota bacterium]